MTFGKCTICQDKVYGGEKYCDEHDYHHTIDSLEAKLTQKDAEIERLKAMEKIFDLCVKDLYSPSGKFKKSTAIKILHYLNK